MIQGYYKYEQTFSQEGNISENSKDEEAIK